MLALAVGEALLFAVYARGGAEVKWAGGGLSATTLRALVNLAYLTLKGAPARGQGVSLLDWHFVAMVADLLADAPGIGQGGRLNVLLEDDLEAWLLSGLGGWLAAALVASGLYGLVLAGWVFARRTEVAAGMPPGVGLGRTHLVRAQRPIGHVRDRRVAARTAHARLPLLEGDPSIYPTMLRSSTVSIPALERELTDAGLQLVAVYTDPNAYFALTLSQRRIDRTD